MQPNLTLYQRVKSGQPVEHDKPVHKSFPTHAKAADQGRLIDFTITTGGVDRDNDTVDPAGWDLKNYQANPVVLFAHDYAALPVGKALSVTMGGDKLSATVEFPVKGMYPFADTVYDMVKAGFLNATSVGFKPSEYTINEDRHGLDFKAQELLEFSIVPIPSNPQALVEARSAGIDLKPLIAWAKSILSKHAPAEIKMSSKDKKAIGYIRNKMKALHSSIAACHDTAQQILDNDSDATASATHATDKVFASMPTGARKSVMKLRGQIKDVHNDHAANIEHVQNLMDDDSSTSSISDETRKTVPANPTTAKAPQDQAWTAPTLKDFTEQGWADLSAGTRGTIAKHFAWAKALPPESFGDLKLPHHDVKSGAVVFRAVAMAAARIDQASIPTADLADVKAHLADHYKQFEKDAPWVRAPGAWSMYQSALEGYDAKTVHLHQLAGMLKASGFLDEAEVLAMTECPKGTACPKTPTQMNCPSGKDCPIQGAALSSVAPAEVKLVNIDEVVLFIKGAGDGQSIDKPPKLDENGNPINEGDDQTVQEDDGDSKTDMVDDEEATRKPKHLIDTDMMAAAVREVVGAVTRDTIRQLRGRID